MQVKAISTSKQNFKGLHINKNVPSYIREAIISNPVIKKAQKKYTIFFDNHDELGLHCMTRNPEQDSIWGVFITAPHSVTTGHHWFKPDKSTTNSSPMGSILSQIENIKSSEFFEKLVGKPRTLKDKLIAIKEAFNIAFSMPDTEEATKCFNKMQNKYKSPLGKTKL